MIFENIYWMTFILFFAIFAKSLWFFYYFSLYAFQPKQFIRSYYGKVALIVPIFNEEEAQLESTVMNIKRARGIDQVIFVNDGSVKNNVMNTLKRVCIDGQIILDISQNVGKRKAQMHGIAKLDPDVDVVVFMDSDTILEENSIVELVKPFQDPEIGGTTACILAENNNQNFLTRCIGAMYWSSSNIWRKGPSNLGFLQVTNGQLSAYRAKLLRRIMPEYTTQEFMGVSCTLSDDRYITHYIQTEFKKEIIYVPSAVAYTHIPHTFRSAYKMFLRWKLGSLREAFLILTKFKKHPLLVIDICANHLVMLMQTIVRIAVLVTAIFFPIILLFYFITIAAISLLFAFDMVFKNAKMLFYKVCYSLLDEIYFRWVFVHALFTIQNQGKWMTR